MRLFCLLLLVAVASSCSGESAPDAAPLVTAADAASTTVESMPTSSPSTMSNPGENATPPSVKSSSASDPVPLPQLGPNHWLVQDWDGPDIVVRTDKAGIIRETVWQQDADVVGSFDAGHTLVCVDADEDGLTDLVDVRYAFEGPLRNMYRETRSIDGNVIAETIEPVDGTTVPSVLHQICSEPSTGPIVRVTAMQWAAALGQAGFTEIAGDHAIDPVWEAAAVWDGVEYWPLNLYQGEFRPEPSDEAELLACDLGAIEIPRNLPADARMALLHISGC